MEEIKNLLDQSAPEAATPPKKRRPILIFFLLSLLILSVIFSFNKQNSNQKEKQFNQVYELTVHQLEQGKALVGLNNLRAVSLLSEAKASLISLQKDFDQKSRQLRTVKDLLTRIDKELEAANQIYKVSPEIFFDLTLLKTGGQGEKITIDKEQIFVLDQKNGVVYQIDARTKAGKIASGAESLNLSIFTAQETDDQYVFDKQNKRVIISDKDGNYKSQYRWTTNQNYSAMVVSEDLKLIFLLEGSKIDSIKMSSPT